MSQRTKRTALYSATLGFLAHYVFSVVLFVSSQLSEELPIHLEVIYLVGAGVPIFALCILTIWRMRRT